MFCTSSKQNSKISWANVKGKAENYILNKGLKDSYMIRLGILIPENGIKPKTKIYNLFYTLITPLFPILKLIPSITTSSKLGKAMINCFYHLAKKNISTIKKLISFQLFISNINENIIYIMSFLLFFLVKVITLLIILFMIIH